MQKRPLQQEMHDFRRQKKVLVPALVSLGFLGLVIPIIPGLLLLGLAVGLVWPRYEWRLPKRLSGIFGRFGLGKNKDVEH